MVTSYHSYWHPKPILKMKKKRWIDGWFIFSSLEFYNILCSLSMNIWVVAVIYLFYKLAIFNGALSVLVLILPTTGYHTVLISKSESIIVIYFSYTLESSAYSPNWSSPRDCLDGIVTIKFILNKNIKCTKLNKYLLFIHFNFLLRIMS